jgi:hypothetical protein
MTEALHRIQDKLKKEIDSNWDADDCMDLEHVRNSPLGEFAIELHDLKPIILERLTFFSALKALPCWELSCDGEKLRNVLRNIKNVIEGNVPRTSLANFTEPIQSPMKDCRYSDTQSTADAAGFCAKYIMTQDPVYAIYSLSGADIAYDHVYTEDNFRDWLIEIAFKVAVDNCEILDSQLNEKSEEIKNYVL